ncbi:uncharacterized protein MELLADRAFT_103324 [Melampsora larici-populina 98AG31]|uniref:DBF4-type domain-containing protein n=1 Tax=Melampsora larici-populina (strain 98AG31 / pathotype 3-4-7) TaxID=747676 RepID=F4RA15_MELLP|nr:uncharacterized protein MELLADRAFT_103324 [Melampsora larici-populina 98AG31]EGG10646.1 hypothetical protein MELLADRAFT_103324 [Melampsora larici-populina 98AG31]
MKLSHQNQNQQNPKSFSIHSPDSQPKSQSQSFLPPPPPTTTTTTTTTLTTKPITPITNHTLPNLINEKDSRSHFNRDKQRVKDELRRETLQWQEKYRVAIKSFVFYLDRLDSKTESELSNELESWGARVDQFFSKDVTHVITNIPVPVNLPILSPSVTNSIKRNTAYQLPVPSPSPSTLHVHPSHPLHFNNKENGPLTRRSSKRILEPNLVSPDPKDGILTDPPQIDPFMRKALEMKIKIWRTEKLRNVLERLEDRRSPMKPLPLMKPSLPSLLAKEAQQGHTHERDPISIRSDYHYFSKQSNFILVEDSNQEFKPIIIKEFTKSKVKDPSASTSTSASTSNQTWPVLFGGTEGKSAFSKYNSKHSLNHVHLRIKQMFEERFKESNTNSNLEDNPNRTPNPNQNRDYLSIPTSQPTQSLRRTMSMNILQRKQTVQLNPTHSKANHQEGLYPDLVNITALEHQRGPGKVFLGASGNSVTITSTNTPSTRSSLAYQSNFLVDKRLNELVKRPTFKILDNLKKENQLVGGGEKNLKRCQSLDQALLEQKKQTDGIGCTNKNQESRRRRGGRKGLGVRDKLGEGFELLDLSNLVGEEEAKAGYCENCRTKYGDFKRHVITRKHRKFATNEDNWWELDKLLERTCRRLRVDCGDLPPSLRELIELRDQRMGLEDEDEEIKIMNNDNDDNSNDDNNNINDDGDNDGGNLWVGF